LARDEGLTGGVMYAATPIDEDEMLE